MESALSKYLEGLLDSKGISQSQLAREIFVSRQQISYVMSGAREMPLDLAMKIESFFNLKDGTLLTIQDKDRISSRKMEMRKELVAKLKAVSAFWSYQDIGEPELSDEDIIENAILHLDMDEIEQLFTLYGRDKVMKTWKERLAGQGDYLRDLNIMMAMYYFGIKKPEQYLRRIESENLKKLLAYA